VYSEFQLYLTPEQREVLTVNNEREKRMSINFRISFWGLPCSELSADVVDRVGDEQVNVQLEKNILQRRF